MYFFLLPFLYSYTFFYLRLLPPLSPLTPHNHLFVVCVHEFFFLFGSTPSPPLLRGGCQPAVSPVLFLFCLLVQFVHQIQHVSEITCYLFSAWLISLSVMFSRSIHAVAKGKILQFHSYVEYSEQTELTRKIGTGS